MSTYRRMLYCTIIGSLTTTALSACCWQISRYYQSLQKWKMISNQLSKQNPDDLAELKHSQLYPLKYVQCNGTMRGEFLLVDRVRNGLIGSLIVRALQYTDRGGHKQEKGSERRDQKRSEHRSEQRSEQISEQINKQDNNKDKCILAVVGWIPENYDYKSYPVTKQFKGILREKQKSDYLHKRMKQTDIDKFNINTYIDLQSSAHKLGIDTVNINQQYYLQVLKNEQEVTVAQTGQSQQYYPQLYKVSNFALPYLTPDKHRAYAMFWGLTSMVGIGAIIKVIKMK